MSCHRRTWLSSGALNPRRSHRFFVPGQIEGPTPADRLPMDKGPELTARAFCTGIESPVPNRAISNSAILESPLSSRFNDKLRDVRRGGETFEMLLKARVLAENTLIASTP
jgi:hypothetical protein